MRNFHGVGEATARKKERLGIRTGADMKARSLPFLQQHLERPAPKTLSRPIFSISRPDAEITPLVAKVWRHCVGKSLRDRTAALKVKYADFQIITRSRTVGNAFSTSAEFETVARNLFDPLFPAAMGIRLIGITISSFEEQGAGGSEQLRLFADRH